MDDDDVSFGEASGDGASNDKLSSAPSMAKSSASSSCKSVA